MKKLLLIMTVLSLAVSGFSQGIIFEKGSFSEILAKAKKENKQVFIDVFTEWCGPCKTLSTTVFPDVELGKLYNSKFVSFKLDAEKGEGIELAKKFKVTAYPTLLYVDSDGNSIHRVVGSKSINFLKEEASKIDGYLKNGSPETYRQRYNSGERDSKFLLQYYKVCTDDEKPVVMNEYLLALPDDQLLSVNNKQFENIRKYNSELMTRLINGLVAIKSNDEAFNFSVTFPIQYLMGTFLNQSITDNNMTMYNEIMALKKKASVLDQAMDPDYRLMSGRGIFFASDDFVNLKNQFKNGKDIKQKNANIRDYIENLIITYPKDTLCKDQFIAFNHFPKSMYDILASQFVSMNSYTSLFLLDCVDYYWRKSETNKAVIADCVKWSNYFFDISPLNQEVALKSANILYRINKPQEAIAVLNRAIEYHTKYNYKEVVTIETLKSTLQDIENKK